MLDNFLRMVAQSSHHTCFYHFTDARNILSIRKNGGLLSMKELIRRGLPCAAPGGNEWSKDADQRFGMDTYVHLCFMNEHPMEYMARNDGRIQNTVWMRIDPTIIKQVGVKITPGVSNKSDMLLMEPSTDIENLDLEVIYQRTDWKDPVVRDRRNVAKKYEILVPDTVPISFIKNLDG